MGKGDHLGSINTDDKEKCDGSLKNGEFLTAVNAKIGNYSPLK